MLRVVFFPSLVWLRAKVLMMTLFPPPVSPTTMVVCLVIMISYNWITLSTCSLEAVRTWYPCSLRSFSTTSLNSG